MGTTPRSARRGLSLMLALALVLGAALAPPTAYADRDRARPTDRSDARPAARTLDLPGADDWSCRPSRARPYPVVIVHGTFGDRRTLLTRLSRWLKRDGHCVFSLDYGRRATGPIERSAEQLAVFVDRVLGATGAVKVSIVGHSQGGMMPRHYLRFLGGAATVEELVGIAPSNHGTANPLLLTPGLSVLCPACLQQKIGSAFLTRLNAGDETWGEVDHTTIVTRTDAVVLPHTSGFLLGDRVTNIRLQSRCPLDLTGHVLLPSNGPTLRIVRHALARSGPASPSYRPSCLP